MTYRLPIKVFDFFSGCGGVSKGFQRAGMEIVFALDNDPESGETFRKNFPQATFLLSDIENKSDVDKPLKPLIESNRNHLKLFCGCASCQPFTKQNTSHPEIDNRRTLLGAFQQQIETYLPELIFVENVPGLQKIEDQTGVFGAFLMALEQQGYKKDYGIIAAQDFGVPQKRRRLVLIASRLGPIELPKETHGEGTDHPAYTTVREWIADLPPIAAGESHPSIPNHRAARLSPANLERICATPAEGDRRSWPESLKLLCHSKDYQGHTDVYGRMHWEKPASGLTTRCISLSNGRFGHPTQDRAISVREAACLQTFPRDFVFHGSLNSMAKQIGNAVPVLLAECFGKHFISHVKQNL